MGRIRSVSGWESSTQVRLDIKTVPADADPYALRIARQLREWYRAAGIDARVTPMSEQELFRQVLLNREFDAFVARMPARFRTPDSLFPLLHSRFVETPGWQNPFGYADLEVNELLETQRRTTGRRRAEAAATLQTEIARTQPFTVLAFPDDIRAARPDRFRGWQGADLRSPTGYLSLDRTAPGRERGTADGTTATAEAASDRRTLRVATTDPRATANLNPLAVEFRRGDAVTGLLYDSLGYETDEGTTEPWLAESWAFSEVDDAHVARVTLRPGTTWHDGTPLTAADVAFTYDLLADTTLDGGPSTDDGGTTADGEGEGERVPAPRFQGRSSLVADAEAVDDRTVEVRFVDCDPTVAARAFTVPVFPEHVWMNRTDTVSLGGLEFGPATEALVTNNIPPVGSGPLRFVRNTPRESLVLEPFADHFLARRPPEELPRGFADAPAFDRLSVRVVGSGVTAVEVVTDGDADVTGTPVGADTVPRIGRAGDTSLVVDGRSAPYVVGYNALRQPLTNPQFRNTLARLVHRPSLVRAVFEGYARPTVSPLSTRRWVPSELRWSGEDPVTPFIGSDGTVDAERAREAFRTAGYSYDGDRLVRTAR
ncbi:ABC transporter substrate-binding protein [Halobacteriales archaeon QS_6_71_20]|nr:MAG: ABC transporter substrate-binding protein [Halobacteriales archaeon QS_6_71_20]